MKRTCRYLLLFLAFFSASHTSWGVAAPDTLHADPRHLDATSMGAPFAFPAVWLAKQGDDASYADPRTDDSEWIVVEGGKALNSYGLKDVDLVWFRAHVHIAPHQVNLALRLYFFIGSADVFVNGVRVGTSGSFPRGGDVTSGLGVQRMMPIPDAVVDSGDLLIAVRASLARSVSMELSRRLSERRDRTGNAASFQS